MNEQIFYKQLVERYTSKKASEEELMVFFQLLDEGKLDQYLGNAFVVAGGEDRRHNDREAIKPSRFPTTPVRKIMIRAAIAACAVAAVSVIFFVFFKPQRSAQQQQPVAIRPNTGPADLSPGGNKATLTLANGASIALENASPEEIATRGKVEIVKNSDGLLAYEQNTVTSSDPQTYNTLATPRGGQYQVKLPDGTMVWLNAASTLRFPTRFNTGERVVQLDGEGYFEVSQHRSMPFTVQMKTGTNIHVLGTHFNIHGYAGEPVKTTLLQGSVRIESPRRSAVLRAGQEAIIQDNGDLKIAPNASDDQAIAWKNGLFEFDRANITTIMSEIQRWYNVEVEYRGEKSTKQFVGKVSRNGSLSEVLAILSLSNIHCKIEGRKVIVLP